MAKELLEEKGPEEIMAAILKITYSEELDENNYTKMRPPRKERGIEEEGKTRVFISLGRKKGYTPKKMVDFIKDTIRLQDRFIDDVSVLDDFSFVTLPFKDAEELISIFKKKSKGKPPLITKAKSTAKSGRSKISFRERNRRKKRKK
jgi:ATP-dependent RNA helicase DeaD